MPTAIRPPAQYDAIVVEWCSKLGVDPNLIRAQIMQESAWNAGAANRACADGTNNCPIQPGRYSAGLMQLTLPTAQQYLSNIFLTYNDLMDPRRSVQGGVTYMNALLRKYGETRAALAAYNWGPGNYDRWMNPAVLISMPDSTVQYMNRIMAYYDQYVRMFPTPGIPPPSPEVINTTPVEIPFPVPGDPQTIDWLSLLYPPSPQVLPDTAIPSTYTPETGGEPVAAETWWLVGGALLLGMGAYAYSRR